MEYNFHNFNETAKLVFKILVDRFGYTLQEIKVDEIKGRQMSAHHVYVNYENDLKIVIKQEPYHTDYGFSFFIHKLGTEEYNILCNVPHEKQDKQGNFLFKAYTDLFSSKEISDIISGKSWRELKQVPFQS